MELDTVRSLLEDIEVIEDAISSRFQRNPELYYDYRIHLEGIRDDIPKLGMDDDRMVNKIYKARKHKRTLKQKRTQQYEINTFLDDIFKKNKYILKVRNQLKSDGLKYKDSECKFELLKKLLGDEPTEDEDEDEDDSISKSNSSRLLDIDETINRYNMNLGNGKLVSERCSLLDINTIFQKDEQDGFIIDFEPLYRRWLNIVKDGTLTYPKFISNLEKFIDDKKYLLDPVMDRKTKGYCEFVVEACDFVETQYFKRNILLNKEQIKAKLHRDFENHVTKAIITESGSYYCLYCDKMFNSAHIYDSHRTGKAHSKSVSNYHDSFRAEFKLHVYVSCMREEFENTKEYVDRKMAFTNKERLEEMEKLTQEYHRPVYDPTEKEGDVEEDNSKSKTKDELKEMLGLGEDMPLGPDGLPIPYWLYKLQGLDVGQECEICGNQVYKGHKNFDKHFSGPTHTYHLKCLGIEPSSAFQGITKIKEAQALWKQMQRNTTQELAEEVEDKEGNVMSKDIYEELKKQGLV